MDGFAGVTAIEVNVTATANTVAPLTVPEVAVIVVVPAATPVASPAVLIVATAAADELQVAELVRFWVLPSLKVPVAVNCWVAPLEIDGFAGVTAIELSVGEFDPEELVVLEDAVLAPPPQPDTRNATPATKAIAMRSGARLVNSIFGLPGGSLYT